MNPQQETYRQFLGTYQTKLAVVQLALGDQAAAARTAEAFAHHCNKPCPEGLPLVAVINAEDLWDIYVIDETYVENKIAEGGQPPDPPNNERREFTLAAHVLLIEALIQDAVQQSLDDPNQFHLVSFLTTAP